jgi:tRNA modification GTPase
MGRLLLLVGLDRYYLRVSRKGRGRSLLKNDTIAAISTPLGEGGIGIVRLSGPEAFAVVKEIFTCSSCNDRDYPRSRFLYYGMIHKPGDQPIDEVLVSFMAAPNTYTREDIVEINCHSGVATLRTILRTVLNMGTRLAEPGEFTRRAFLNGRIDLSQAESVIGLIRTRTEEGLKASFRSLRGELATTIRDSRAKIIALQAPLEASIDYPEEFTENSSYPSQLKAGIKAINNVLVELLKGIGRSRAYQEGVTVTIIGRPNVGKSSLMNRLLGEQRAIVHEMPGTTRDLLEGQAKLGEYPLRLIDTAGIHGTLDPVEEEGIKRARGAAGEARLILYVIDGSSDFDQEDGCVLIEAELGQALIIVINKSDLPQQVSDDDISFAFPGSRTVKISALHGMGIDTLEQAVTDELDKLFGKEQNNPLLISIRQEELIREALNSLEKASATIEKEPLEIISFNLRDAWQKLGEITGDSVSDDLLDRIFSEFCLGK